MHESDDLFCAGQIIVEIMQGKPIFERDEDAQRFYEQVDTSSGSGSIFPNIHLAGTLEETFAHELLDRDPTKRPTAQFLSKR